MKTDQRTANAKRRPDGTPPRRITIVGTGCIGTSIGLALRERTAQAGAERLEIVGHDRDPGRARQAEKLGAFDRTAINLDLALRGAQLVIVAVPLAALYEVFQDIGRLLAEEEGVVITDTAPLKAPAMQWAESTLPTGCHYVGGDPFLAPGSGGWEPLHGPADASAGLFDEAMWAIVAGPQDHPSAVRTVANLALVLGAAPLFMGPNEHDAVRLISMTVPALVGAALFEATRAAPGWPEVRKAAGREFATATAGVSGDIASQRMSVLLGRETVLRGLDAVIDQLSALRARVASDDAEGLEAVLAAATEERSDWRLQSEVRAWRSGRSDRDQESLLDRTLQVLLGEGLTGKSGRA